jgi:hypothetical protein
MKSSGLGVGTKSSCENLVDQLAEADDCFVAHVEEFFVFGNFYEFLFG